MMNQLILRQVRAEDLPRIADIEAQCFPAAEAASLETFIERFAVFPEHFYAAELDGQIIGFINGCVTSSPVIFDGLFHDAALHEPEGPNVTVFGIDVAPEYQRRGIAAELIRHFIAQAEKEGRKAVILTCKDHLVHYYASFGFTSSGVSESTHGGAIWYDMTLEL